MQSEFNSIILPYSIPIDPNKFREMVAEHAYFKAEKSGFTPGHEMEDWLEAEEEVKKQCFYCFQEVE